MSMGIRICWSWAWVLGFRVWTLRDYCKACRTLLRASPSLSSCFSCQLWRLKSSNHTTISPHTIAHNRFIITWRQKQSHWGNAHEGFCGPPPAIRRATWRKEIGRLIGGCGRVWRPRTSPRQLPRQVTLTGLLHRVFFKVTETSGGRRVLAVVPGAGRTPLPRQAAVDELRRRPPGSAIFFAHVRGPILLKCNQSHWRSRWEHLNSAWFVDLYSSNFSWVRVIWWLAVSRDGRLGVAGTILIPYLGVPNICKIEICSCLDTEVPLANPHWMFCCDALENLSQTPTSQRDNNRLDISPDRSSLWFLIGWCQETEILVLLVRRKKMKLKQLFLKIKIPERSSEWGPWSDIQEPLWF